MIETAPSPGVLTLIEQWTSTFNGEGRYDSEANCYYWRMKIGKPAEFRGMPELHSRLSEDDYWIEDSFEASWLCRRVEGEDLLRGFLHWLRGLSDCDRQDVDEQPAEVVIQRFLRDTRTRTALKTKRKARNE